jgi:hypothetical protein
MIFIFRFINDKTKLPSWLQSDQVVLLKDEDQQTSKLRSPRRFSLEQQEQEQRKDKSPKQQQQQSDQQQPKRQKRKQLRWDDGDDDDDTITSKRKSPTTTTTKTRKKIPSGSKPKPKPKAKTKAKSLDELVQQSDEYQEFARQELLKRGSPAGPNGTAAVVNLFIKQINEQTPRTTHMTVKGKKIPINYAIKSNTPIQTAISLQLDKLIPITHTH